MSVMACHDSGGSRPAPEKSSHMTFPDKFLGEGEQIVVELRTHAKALIGPALVFVGVSFLGSFGAATVPPGPAQAALRLVAREGVLARQGRDLPLWCVTDVSVSRTLGQRLFGCGTLVVTTGDRSIVVADLPLVEHVHRELYRLTSRASPSATGADHGQTGDLQR